MISAPNITKPIRVSDKERARADDGRTIIVRSQPNGTWLIALVDVQSGEVLPRSAVLTDDRTEISKEIAGILRMWNKMGVGGMAEASRNRLWQKYQKQEKDRASLSAEREAALHTELVRMAAQNPELRGDLLPLLDKQANVRKFASQPFPLAGYYKVIKNFELGAGAWSIRIKVGDLLEVRSDGSLWEYDRSADRFVKRRIPVQNGYFVFGYYGDYYDLRAHVSAFKGSTERISSSEMDNLISALKTDEKKGIYLRDDALKILKTLGSADRVQLRVLPK